MQEALLELSARGGRIAAGGGRIAGVPFAAGLIAGGLFASGLNAATRVFLGGQKIKSGKCHELPRKSIKKMFKPWVTSQC